MSHHSRKRPCVLICADWFAPGVRAGGPIRSCVNLVDLLHRDLRFMVLTGDRDLGGDTTYEGILPGRWNNWQSKAAVWYASRQQRATCAFSTAIRRCHPDAIYLNSMFSPLGTILPVLESTRHPGTRLILAPRGMLKPSALAHRTWKKRGWLAFLKQTRLSRHITFHATSDVEAAEVRECFGHEANIVTVSNVPTSVDANPSPIRKDPHSLEICCIGRIHPVKNVLFAIRILKQVKFACQFTLVGPIEDTEYHRQCESEIAMLPANVHVRFTGAVTHDETQRVLRQSHLMFLPTLGENFGHAIYESLSAGIPVLTSDQTYWRGLQQSSAGWDLPLSAPDGFQSALESAAAAGHDDWNRFRIGARKRAEQYLLEHDFRTAYLRLFGVE
ncbi:MAG: glycosyltransferase family 4 protein [Planctomycetaceae bacterium]|nr:glycosyltransferase family 4 protein [Planctomycetaceae bacterium]